MFQTFSHIDPTAAKEWQTEFFPDCDFKPDSTINQEMLVLHQQPSNGQEQTYFP